MDLDFTIDPPLYFLAIYGVSSPLPAKVAMLETADWVATSIDYFKQHYTQVIAVYEHTSYRISISDEDELIWEEVDMY